MEPSLFLKVFRRMNMPEERARCLDLRQSLNPLQLHRELDEFIAGLQHPSETAMSAD